MDWQDSYGMMGILVLLWLGGFGLVVLKLRKVSEELENRVRHRTADLNEANRQLELEIHERKFAEETIRQARDFAQEHGVPSVNLNQIVVQQRYQAHLTLL